MGTIAVVTTKSELRTAVENKVGQIFITEPDLARQVKTIKSASRWAIGVAMAAAASGALALVNEWNPLGWASTAAFGITAGTLSIIDAALIGAVAALFMTLGLGIYAIYKDYNFKGNVKFTTPNGEIVEADLELTKK